MIDDVTNGQGPSGISPRPVDNIRKQESREIERTKPAETTPAAPDSAKISDNAAEISRYQELVRLHREAYGETDRSEKLNEVREKIKNGFYDSPEMIESLTEMVVERAIPDAVKTYDLENVRRRVDTGYYDRPDVLNKTAENMLKDVNIKKPE